MQMLCCFLVLFICNLTKFMPNRFLFNTPNRPLWGRLGWCEYIEYCANLKFALRLRSFY